MALDGATAVATGPVAPGGAERVPRGERAAWPPAPRLGRSMPASLEDADLVQRCRCGDQEAWRALVQRHAPLVHGVVRGAFRLQGHDAEDVFQEVFARVYLRLGSVRDAAALRAWIAQIARNASLDWLRRDGGGPHGNETDDLAFEEPLGRLEDALIVRDALARLPEHQQEILDRFFARDESYQTISAALGLPAGTIASRISRALGSLRVQLGDELGR